MTRCCKTFNVVHMMGGFFVANAPKNQYINYTSMSFFYDKHQKNSQMLLFIGSISWGMTGKTLCPALTNISCIPCSDINLNGFSFSVKPSKNIGR